MCRAERIVLIPGADLQLHRIVSLLLGISSSSLHLLQLPLRLLQLLGHFLQPLLLRVSRLLVLLHRCIILLLLVSHGVI